MRAEPVLVCLKRERRRKAMTIITETHHASAHTNRAAWIGRLRCMVVGLVKTWQNHRALSRLSELTDRELSDIGVTRSDLHLAAGSRWQDDPTRRLASLACVRAQERERAQRMRAGF
ncbi:unnamed protein product [Laminaria digitata]